MFSHKKRRGSFVVESGTQNASSPTVPQGCCQWDIIILVRVCEPCEDDRAHSLLRLLQGLMKNSHYNFEHVPDVPTCVRDSRPRIFDLGSWNIDRICNTRSIRKINRRVRDLIWDRSLSQMRVCLCLWEE